MYKPALFLNPQRHVLIFLRETDESVEFIQRTGSKIELKHAEKKKFYRDCALDKGDALVLAAKFLSAAKTGVTITPAARFALQQVNRTTTQEAQMAVPTTTPSKTAAKKAAPVKDTAVNQDDKLTPPKTVAVAAKAEPVSAIFKDTALDTSKKALTPHEQLKKAEAAQHDQSAKNEKAEAPVSDIVAEAKAKAEKLISEAQAMLEEAKRKHEEKLAAETAKAEAEKILAAAKKEVEKIKAQVAKLGGKRSTRKAKGETTEASSTRANYSEILDKKIKKLADPVIREGSAAGLRTEAIYNSKTVKEALEYQGVTPFYIVKLVNAGYIELV